MKHTSSLIILHGWSLDHLKLQQWKILRDMLSERGISSEMLKIPGLSAPLNEVWDLDNYVAWLDKELTGKEKVILLGHSFGGQISVRYTAKYPHKVSSLILVDSAGIRDHSFLATLKRNGFRVMAKIGKIFFNNELFRKVLYKLARERDYQNAPPLLRRTMSQILDAEVVDDLPKIKCPTLLIWGKDDKVTPLFLGQIFQETIPNNKMKIIEGARHSPQYTHPEKVANMVAEFLSQEKESK